MVRRAKRSFRLATSIAEELWFGEADDEAAAQKARESLAALAARVHGVRPFPMAAQRLIRATRDEESTVAAIATILESDSALAARALQLANSAELGLRTPCASVNHAVVLLGPRRVGELAVLGALMQMFDDGGAEATRVMAHASQLAAVARALADHFDLDADDMFTCGILHDIGKLMILQVGEMGYARLLQTHDGEALVAEERRLFGFDHGILAGHVLRGWSIPEPVPTVVALYHQPARAYGSDPEIGRTVHVLRLADRLTHELTAEPPDAASLDALTRGESATVLDLSSEDLGRLWPGLYRALEATKRGESAAGEAPESAVCRVGPRAGDAGEEEAAVQAAAGGTDTPGEADSAGARARSRARLMRWLAPLAAAGAAGLGALSWWVRTDAAQGVAGLAVGAVVVACGAVIARVIGGRRERATRGTG